MSEIDRGAVVRHNGVGHKMTVESVADGKATCAWVAGGAGEVHRRDFPVAALHVVAVKAAPEPEPPDDSDDETDEGGDELEDDVDDEVEGEDEPSDLDDEDAP